MKIYKRFFLMPSLCGIVNAHDAQKALKRGADDLMGIAEFSLRDRPFALKRAREAYTEVCLRLYCAIQEAQR
jgi:hypothetical protein